MWMSGCVSVERAKTPATLSPDRRSDGMDRADANALRSRWSANLIGGTANRQITWGPQR